MAPYTHYPRTVYRISDEDADTGSTLERWIRRDYRQLFESELEGWSTDPSLWPEDRSLYRFSEWIDVECHTVLVDTVGGVICDDDAQQGAAATTGPATIIR
jgi:hypothetical protein